MPLEHFYAGVKAEDTKGGEGDGWEDDFGEAGAFVEDAAHAVGQCGEGQEFDGAETLKKRLSGKDNLFFRIIMIFIHQNTVWGQNEILRFVTPDY